MASSKRTNAKWALPPSTSPISARQERITASTIGIFDSGVGGLSAWREIVRRLPQEDVSYVADQAHVPYGPRRPDEIRKFSIGIARFLLELEAKVIVIACNTASSAALHHLRQTFPGVPFVGMEPAVKPAVERTRSGVVGLVATRTTVQGQLLADLMDRYARDVRVLTRVGTGLVEAVERGETDTPETTALLREHLTPLLEAGIDQLVLGCSHYHFLRPAVRRVVGESVGVIEPATAIARQAERVMVCRGDAAPKSQTGRHVFYTSDDASRFSDMLGRLIPCAGANEGVHTLRWQKGRLVDVDVTHTSGQ